MAIETTLQARQKWWNILYAVICAVLGAWGAYDYWVTIPRKEAEVAAYEVAATAAEEMEAKARAATAAPGGAQPLSVEDVKAYEAAKAVVDKGKPVAPAAYDRPVQLWLYIIGCGVLGVPWFLWEWLSAASKKYRLNADGSFEFNGRTIPMEDIADIDMAKWMSKSVATVVAKDGTRITLDDYKFKNSNLIIGGIAARLYPNDWDTDGRDLNKIRAQEEAAADAEAAELAAANQPAADSTTDKTV
jgi:hypothetical protein